MLEYFLDHPWLTLFSVLVVSVYLYGTRNHRYWKKRGVAGPTPWPVVGHNLNAFVNQVPLQMEQIKKYGKVYGVFEMNEPILRVAEPELIRRIMVKDFNVFVDRRPGDFFGDPLFDKNVFALHGDEWRRVRSVVSPAFSSGKMRKMFAMVNECVPPVLTKFSEAAADGAAVEIDKLLTCFTMDVIGRVAFGTKFNSHQDPNNPFFKHAERIFKPDVFGIIKFLVMLMVPRKLMKALNISVFDKNIMDFFTGAIDAMVKQRLETPNRGRHYNDFLQLLINASEKGDGGPEITSDDTKIKSGYFFDETGENLVFNPSPKTPLSEIELKAQGFTFLLDGYLTTATQLAYLFHSLATNPEVQDKLYEEITEVFGTDDEIDYDRLTNNMPYLDACFTEMTRMYTFVFYLERCASERYPLGDTGITIEKDQVVQIPIWFVHHNPEWYPEPEKFKPERFLAENRHLLEPYTYLSFGTGPRACIGMRFAIMESKLVTVEVLRQFRLTRHKKTQVPLELRSEFLLMPKDSIFIGAEKRQK